MMAGKLVCSEVSSFILRTTFPTEEQQFAVYKQVAGKHGRGKKVIIRTLDIGADKQVDYFNLDKEENPALGYKSNSYLSDETGNFQDAAAGPLPCGGIWKPVHYVPNDHFRK